MTNEPEQHPSTCEVLIEQARTGNASALSDLLNLLREPLRAFILGLMPVAVKSSLDAEDILQETHFLAFRRFATFTTGGLEDFKRWLFTIARHCLVDHVRASQAAKRTAHHVSDAITVSGSMICLLEELAVYRRTPSQSAASHELIAAIEEALSRIPEQYGEALRLRYLNQLSVAETAARIGKTERAVHMLCNRGLKTMRLEMRSGGRFI